MSFSQDDMYQTNSYNNQDVTNNEYFYYFDFDKLVKNQIIKRERYLKCFLALLGVVFFVNFYMIILACISLTKTYTGYYDNVFCDTSKQNCKINNDCTQVYTLCEELYDSWRVNNTLSYGNNLIHIASFQKVYKQNLYYKNNPLILSFTVLLLSLFIGSALTYVLLKYCKKVIKKL